MPGKKQALDLTAPDVIQIAGEKWRLVPIVGMKSFFVVPKIIGLVSKIVYSALRADFDLRGIFGGTEGDFDILSKVRVENLMAIPYMMETLDQSKDDIVNEILPALLCKDSVWLLNNGKPAEFLEAIFKAFSWHAPSIFGEKPWAALKKLISVSGEEVEAEAEEQVEATDSTSSEA